MARTRAQEKKEASASATKDKPAKKQPDPKRPAKSKRKDSPLAKDEHGVTPPPAKRSKQKDASISSNVIKDNPRINELLAKYGTFPLQDTSLAEPTSPEVSTLLAHVFNAMLSSTRISHNLAAKTLRTVIEAGYADLGTLEKTTWEERTRVLTEGGYTHYREKTATQLGELAQLVRQKYDGDLNNLLSKAKDSGGSNVDTIRKSVREGIREIKGIGNVALDVFCDTVQGLWHEIAPFLDPRSQNTAEALGISTDPEQLYQDVGKDPMTMGKLASALTTVRLEKLEKQFT